MSISLIGYEITNSNYFPSDWSVMTVPFYDTLGPESVQFILKQTSTKTVVSTRAELGRLCTVKKSGLCPHFQVVVLVDGVTANAADMAKQAGLEVMSFAKVEAGVYFVFSLCIIRIVC
jgi:long-subunit acyl-CoA synthetase (AMP-forming)